MAAAQYYLVTQQLFVAYLGRPAGPLELAAVARSLENGKAPVTLPEVSLAYYTDATIKRVVDGLANSAESDALYGALDIDDFVNMMFHDVLNRTLRPGELDYWRDEIAYGRIRKTDAAMKIMSGAFDSDDHPALSALDQQLLEKAVPATGHQEFINTMQHNHLATP